MKFVRILALILVVCMMSCAFIACDNGNGEDATTDGSSLSGSMGSFVPSAVNMKVTLVIKGGKSDVRETILYEGDDALLSNVINFYNEFYKNSTEACFNSIGILTKIGDLEGDWTAYDEDKGSKNGKIESIAEFVVEDGMTIVLTCKPLAEETETETEAE